MIPLGEDTEGRAVGMIRLLTPDTNIIETQGAQQSDDIVALQPAVHVVNAAAKRFIHPGAVIASPMASHCDAVANLRLHGSDECGTARIPRGHLRLIGIMRPQEERVGAPRHQFYEPHGILHVIKDARCDDEIISLRTLFKPALTITKEEPCDPQLQKLLDDKAPEERKLVGFHSVQLGGSILLNQPGVRGFQRPNLKNRFAMQSAKLLNRPENPSIMEEKPGPRDGASIGR